MILDVARFTAVERPYWQELDALLRRLDNDPGARLDLAQTERFHYLYQRCSADLSRLVSLAAASSAHDDDATVGETISLSGLSAAATISSNRARR